MEYLGRALLCVESCLAQQKEFQIAGTGCFFSSCLRQKNGVAKLALFIAGLLVAGMSIGFASGDKLSAGTLHCDRIPGLGIQKAIEGQLQ